MHQDNEHIKIDLLKIFNGMVHRVWAIILTMILCGGLLFSYATFLVTPLYKANILIYVNNSSFSVGSTSVSISSSQITAAQSLVNTYMVILKARMTLNEVISAGNLDYSYEQLSKMISTESVGETEVFSVTVTSKDPFEAEHIANTIALILPDKIADVVVGSSARIVDYAVVPAQKASPNISRYTILGLLMGLVLSCGVIAVIEIMDDQIDSEEYLLSHFGNIPLLAAIPDMMVEKHDSYYRKGYYHKGYYGYGYHKEEKEGEGQ